MILPVFGINPHGSSEYKEIMKMLRQLGLSPTGNIEIDRSRLRKALETRKEKFEIEQKRNDQIEVNPERRTQEEERKGAELWALYNRLFFGI